MFKNASGSSLVTSSAAAGRRASALLLIFVLRTVEILLHFRSISFGGIDLKSMFDLLGNRSSTTSRSNAHT